MQGGTYSTKMNEYSIQKRAQSYYGHTRKTNENVIFNVTIINNELNKKERRGRKDKINGGKSFLFEKNSWCRFRCKSSQVRSEVKAGPYKLCRNSRANAAENGTRERCLSLRDDPPCLPKLGVERNLLVW